MIKWHSLESWQCESLHVYGNAHLTRSTGQMSSPHNQNTNSKTSFPLDYSARRLMLYLTETVFIHRKPGPELGGTLDHWSGRSPSIAGSTWLCLWLQTVAGRKQVLPQGKHTLLTVRASTTPVHLHCSGSSGQPFCAWNANRPASSSSFMAIGWAPPAHRRHFSAFVTQAALGMTA